MNRHRILHVDVGGRYGGSVKALESYLAYSDRTRFEHEVLFYRPSAAAEQLAPFVRDVRTLYETPPNESSGSRSPARRSIRVLLTKLGLANAATQLQSGVEILLQLPAIYRLVRLLRVGDYDLVHVNNTFHYQPLALIAAWWTNIPVVAHVRNPVPAGILSRTLMRLSKCVVTVNRTFARELRGWRTNVGIRVCRDAVVITAPDKAATEEVRRTLAPSGTVLIGSSGRLDDQKGYDILIRAASIVVNRYPNVYFAVAGDGPLFSTLSALASELGVSDHFQLCGFRPDIQNFVAALDLFVSSSNWEGLPLAVMEAMLLNRPVVATDAGGTPEIVRQGITGYLVPKRKPEALASAIIEALEYNNYLGNRAERISRFVARLTCPKRSAATLDEIIALAVSVGKLSKNEVANAGSDLFSGSPFSN